MKRWIKNIISVAESFQIGDNFIKIKIKKNISKTDIVDSLYYLKQNTHDFFVFFKIENNKWTLIGINAKEPIEIMFFGNWVKRIKKIFPFYEIVTEEKTEVSLDRQEVFRQCSELVDEQKTFSLKQNNYETSIPYFLYGE